MFCRRCHYDLSRTEAGRCPEGGTPFSPEDAATYFAELPRLSPWAMAGRVVMLLFVTAVLAFAVMFHYAASQSGH